MTLTTAPTFDHDLAGISGRLSASPLHAASRRFDGRLLHGLTAALDFLFLVVLGLAIAAGYAEDQWPMPDLAYVLATLLPALLTVLASNALGVYRPELLRSPLLALPRQIGAWIIVLCAIAVGLFLAKSGAAYSRIWFAAWGLTGVIAFVGLRAGLARCVDAWTRNGRLRQRAVIYGAGATTRELIARLEANPDCDLSILGIFDDRGPERDGIIDIAGYPRIGTLAELVACVRTSDIDTIIVTLPVTAEARLGDIFERLSVLPADIRIPALASRLRLSPSAYTHVGGVPMLAVFDKPITGWSRVVKSVFDRTVAALALLALAPVLATIAAAVKLDSRGPVFFRQKRHGFNNELIDVFKFRSMHIGDLDANAARLVTKGDPRVTPVGRFIRKTSLDELPQLFNVLMGDLSLVGPRPHALQAKAADRLYADVTRHYFARHKVKPGITGWAQINGWRGETDTEEKLEQRVAHDLWYIENWSPLLDLYILAKTPLALLKTENAY